MNEEIFKKEINDVFIKTQCKLNKIQIKLSGNKYIETDYLLPFWDEFSISNASKYVLVSKKYILIDINETYNIIELTNLEKYREDKSKVKIHKIILPQGFKIESE